MIEREGESRRDREIEREGVIEREGESRRERKTASLISGFYFLKLYTDTIF